MRISLNSGKPCVVLLSGGLDSATALYFAKKEGFAPVCLIFDYGQRHKREIVSAKRIARAAGSSYRVLKIFLPWQGSSLLDKKICLPQNLRDKGSGVTGPSTALRAGKGHFDCAQDRQGVSKIPSTYVPGRNIIFLSFALSFAEVLGAEAIFIGANSIDYSGYPDCRPEFYRAFEEVISSGTKAGVERTKIKIWTPLIDLTKAQIIKLGNSLGVPYELSWSCYQGKLKPCGKCESCFYRAKGFRDAGQIDPAGRVK